MRDPNRIPEVLKALQYYWSTYPDLRLGQLIYCITCGKDIFNIEDEELLRLMEEWDRNKFHENLVRASEVVKSWPKWKQDIFGMSTKSTSPDGKVVGKPPNTGEHKQGHD